LENIIPASKVKNFVVGHSFFFQIFIEYSDQPIIFIYATNIAEFTKLNSSDI
jgi:hypothetical protein